MHILKSRPHGYLDYAAILFLFVMPSLFDLVGPAVSLTYGVAVLYLAMVLLTAYPAGVFKLIPFYIHGAIEFALAIGMIVAPWALRFADDPVARGLYVGLGIGLFLVWLVTDYRGAESHERLHGAAHR